MNDPVSSNRTSSPAGMAGIRVAAVGLSLATALVAVPAAAQERGGAEIVKSLCSHCHEAGTAGAPKPGDKSAWAPRFSRGVDALVGSAIHGHGGMPPRAGKADLTDAELRSALLYMFNPGGLPKVPPTSAKAPPPRGAGPHRVTAGGLDIYLGRVSAERLRGYPAGSMEAKMHGGVPRGSGYYHVNVSVFDATSQAQVTGATVELDVEQLGRGSEPKVLEPHTIAGGASYGGYVRLVPRSDYTFTVRVRKAGSTQLVEAKFHERLD